MVLALDTPLKLKYRTGKQYKNTKGKASGNNGPSNGKHNAHPEIHGFRRNGNHCDPKWNRHEKDL